MRRLLVILAVALVPLLVLLVVGWGRTGESAAKPSASANSVYFGWVLGTKDITAIALDVEAPDARGRRVVRAYVCDGLGFPNGLAVWFLGKVDTRLTNQPGKSQTMVS